MKLYVRQLPIAIGAIFLAACGGSGATGNASPTATPKPTLTVDSCVVGRWISGLASGFTVQNGQTVIAGGGAGQIITITGGGLMTVDDTNAQPATLTGNGQQATIRFTGMSYGTVKTSAGSLTYKPAAGSTEAFTLYRPDGTPVGTPSVDTGFTASYMCTRGRSFGINAGGGFGITYAPG
jgi:hypothetical protein